MLLRQVRALREKIQDSQRNLNHARTTIGLRVSYVHQQKEKLSAEYLRLRPIRLQEQQLVEKLEKESGDFTEIEGKCSQNIAEM